MGLTSYSVPTSYQIPLQHSIQDCVAVLERITTQLHRFSDAAYLPMNPIEIKAAKAAVDAIEQVLKGAEAVTTAELEQWGL